MNDKPRKKCFVISPIGPDGSPERDIGDWFRKIVHEALSETYTIERADDHKELGLITTQIIQLIEEADLIVVDLTGHNPNVHYELGVAHARNKQVIPMMMTGDRPPFDNAHMRTIFYSRANPRDYDNAVAKLRAAADGLTEPVQNLVTHALGTLNLSQGDTEERVIATVSAEVERHDAEIADLQKAFNDLVGIVARGLPAPTTTVVPQGNPYFHSNALHNPLAGGGGLFGLGLIAPSTEKSNALGMFVDPTKTDKMK